MTNHCGTCTACCRVFDVPQVKSPAGEWCTHCAIGKGCKIYEARPEPCVTFTCLWLQSQQREDPREHMPVSLRPDKSKVVLATTTNPNVISAVTLPGSPTAWRRPDVRAVINALVKDGVFGVVVGAPASTTRTMVDRDGEHEVRLTEPDATGMQYNIRD